MTFVLGEVWRSGAWPKAGTDWVSLFEAAARAGAALYGPDWDGSEWRCTMPVAPPINAERLGAIPVPILPASMPPQAPPRSIASIHLSAAPHAATSAVPKPARHPVALTLEQQRAHDAAQAANADAFGRMSKVAAWLGECGRAQRFRTALLPPWDGAELILKPASLWNGADDLARLSRGTAAHWAGQTKFECSIFIYADDLSRELAALKHADAAIDRISLASFSDQLRFAVAIAQKWNCDRAWVPPKQPALVAEIHREWQQTRGSPLSPTAAANIAFVLKGFSSE